MTDERGQVALQASVSGLILRLRGCQSALRHVGGVEQIQHREFAQRARLLAMYLEQAAYAADSMAYPVAFALLRAGLDHRVFDRLLFLASVHHQIFEGVTDEVWQRWQAEPPAHLHSWERLPRNRVRVVWQGPQVVDDQGHVLHQLSIYYKWWQDYDPFVVPAKDLEQIAAGHPSRRPEMAAYSETQRELWQEALAWKNLKANLRMNDLATEREVVQLDVHHRFLSAFVHPFSQDVTDRVYHPHYHGDWPIEDHYAQELVLLYAGMFAIDELRDFERMTTREPRVELAGWDEVRGELAIAESQIAHLWPPGRPPYPYDKTHEANQRVFDIYDAQIAAKQSTTRPAIPDPRGLPDEEIRYYPDPLRRLVRLHATSTEGTTGLRWLSPWPRADAQYRR